MPRFATSWIFILFFLLLDFYVFQAVKTIAVQWPDKLARRVFLVYWMISVLSLGFFLSMFFISFESWHKLLRTYLFATIVGLFLAKFLSGLFFLMDDLRRGVQYLAGIWMPSVKPAEDGEGVSRSVFLSWVGLITGGGLFGSLLYGFGNKYRYTLKKNSLHFPNLPSAFKGLKIIHISDIHSGSFTDKEAVKRGVAMIQEQEPDLILFTGDLVNYKADEMEPYLDLFGSLTAPHGIYSILGNHDYGFPDRKTSDNLVELHQKNAAAVATMHERMGWKLLRNEAVCIEKNNDCIAVLGVENISAKVGFPSYGNLSKTWKGMEEIPFKILMSHDPSHWKAEVTKQYKGIDLTLSGHTHGMQFGVEIPGFRWSPVKYVYNQWAGLYEEGDQRLYVNRGFGFIGYPGRVGILPEITLIELV
ncbi:MAG: metallophosphoesterase [Bacteroidetes bacterium]|nr:metallophosphoesterase [Bacteroidota bacterium]